jgi:surfeit locus 1 family protein
MHNPFHRKWLPLTLAIIALTILFVLLGIWQLQRLGQRRETNALIVARMEQPLLTVDGSALGATEVDLRRAAVTGRYDPTHEIILRNRTYNEMPGVHVLTPLRIAGSDAAILVDRGWIPYDQSTPEKRAAYAAPIGEVGVQGILRRTQERRSALTPRDAAPPGGGRLDAWHRVDIARIQQQLPYSLLPVYLELEPDVAAEAAFTLPRPDPDVDLDEGPHLVYAIQWFAFALIAAGGYFILYRSRAA